jgi:hypothetical protein
MAGLVGPGADGVDDVAGCGMLVYGVVGGGSLHLVMALTGLGNGRRGGTLIRLGVLRAGKYWLMG